MVGILQRALILNQDHSEYLNIHIWSYFHYSPFPGYDSNHILINCKIAQLSSYLINCIEQMPSHFIPERSFSVGFGSPLFSSQLTALSSNVAVILQRGRLVQSSYNSQL